MYTGSPTQPDHLWDHVKSGLFYDHSWAGNRGSRQISWGSSLTPTKLACLGHVQAYSLSVAQGRVPRDIRHLCPRLFKSRQAQVYLSWKKICYCILFLFVHNCLLFLCRLKINHMTRLQTFFLFLNSDCCHGHLFFITNKVFHICGHIFYYVYDASLCVILLTELSNLSMAMLFGTANYSSYLPSL